VWNDFKRYTKFPRTQKLLLCEALIALATARVAMACLPFKWIAAWLGTPGVETPDIVAPDQILIAKEISWAVSRLAPRVPWDGRCLAQALAATGMLRRRGLEGTVSFGAGRNSSAKFGAHAWLRVGSVLVTGAPEHEQFKAFTTFARRRV
jgi:hypothetical protein